MDNDGELELVERCRRRDRAALEQLISRYQRPVYNTAYRMLGNVEDAHDIAQTVFLKVFERLDDFNPKYRFFSWIYRITVNESLNLLRRNRRETTIEDPDNDAGDSPDPEALAGQAAEGTQVLGALMKLKTEDRAVLILRHYADLSYHEIAGILAIPDKTVKSRLYSARQRMRDLLK